MILISLNNAIKVLSAIATGALGVKAWYTADANAKVNAATATGNLTTTASSIDAGTYTINFTVTPGDSELELSHVVTSADVSGGLNGIASPTAGKLVYGVISNGTATMREVTTLPGNFATNFSIGASWASTPTDPADVAYLGGKSFTINLSVTGNAHFLGAGTATTGQSNVDSATAIVHIAASTLALTVDNISLQYVHIEPTSISASENGTVGAIVVDSANNVSLS